MVTLECEQEESLWMDSFQIVCSVEGWWQSRGKVERTGLLGDVGSEAGIERGQQPSSPEKGNDSVPEGGE